jgi:hypothetical protein
MESYHCSHRLFDAGYKSGLHSSTSFPADEGVGAAVGHGATFPMNNTVSTKFGEYFSCPIGFSSGNGGGEFSSDAGGWDSGDGIVANSALMFVGLEIPSWLWSLFRNRERKQLAVEYSECSTTQEQENILGLLSLLEGCEIQ